MNTTKLSASQMELIAYATLYGQITEFDGEVQFNRFAQTAASLVKRGIFMQDELGAYVFTEEAAAHYKPTGDPAVSDESTQFNPGLDGINLLDAYLSGKRGE